MSEKPGTTQQVIVRKQGDEYVPHCKGCGAVGQLKHSLPLAQEWCRRHRQVNKNRPECQVQP
jgi:uncharacterized Zn finger protein